MPRPRLLAHLPGSASPSCWSSCVPATWTPGECRVSWRQHMKRMNGAGRYEAEQFLQFLPVF